MSNNVHCFCNTSARSTDRLRASTGISKISGGASPYVAETEPSTTVLTNTVLNTTKRQVMLVYFYFPSFRSFTRPVCRFTGICTDGDDCAFLHRTAGDTERRYHLRYYKTAPCVHETDARGFCVKNGVHCAFAHGNSDLRNPVYDVRDLRV